MTHITHISLDLETWGTDPGCDLRSIGACVFDPATGWVAGHDAGMDDGGIDQMHTFYIATDNPAGRWRNGRFETELARGANDRRYPLIRDPRTVKWWGDQSDEAQAAFANPVDLRVGLIWFAGWLTNLTGNIYDPSGIVTDRSPYLRLYSHGAAFDPPILAAAYRACGLPVPWHYRAPRDTRTNFDDAGIDDHSAWLAAHPGPLGIPHHALDDSIGQARGVCRAFERLRAPQDLLLECAKLFRSYEASHRAKVMPTAISRDEGQFFINEVAIQKAERNAEIAQRIERFLTGTN